MQHLDNAAVTGDQYAVLQFKGPVCRYAGHSLVAGVRQEQDSADKPVWLSLDQCSAVTGQGTPAGQYTIYMLGLGVLVEVLKAPNWL